MKRVMLFLLLALMSSAALADPPSDASIRELFEITHIQTFLVTLRSTMGRGMQQGFAAATANKNLTVEQQRIVDGYMRRMETIFDEELVWSKIEPIYLQVYRENFTQDEIDAINAFYRTPAGQAVIEKMPASTQRAAQLMQPNIQEMLKKMQALQADATKQLAATQSPSATQAATTSQPQTPQ